MKRTTLFFVSTLFCLAGYSQVYTAAQKNQPVQTYSKNDLISLHDAQEIVAQISAALEMENIFFVKQGNVKNIEASIRRKKQRIIYNPIFVNDLRKVTNSRWAVVALFAHEVGHHKKGHTSGRSGSKPQLELEADELAGYVLRKMGATLEESTQVMDYIASIRGSKTHPGRNDRSLAITNGWMKGNQEIQAASASADFPIGNTRGSGTTN